MEEESKKIENPALKIVDGHAVKDPKDYQDPDELYDVLIERIRQYHPSADLTIVQKAYQLAKDAHEGQFRKSGEPYIIHPLWVGIILANLELDKETIVAGILHDVVEDTVMRLQHNLERKLRCLWKVSRRLASCHIQRIRISLRCRQRRCVRCFLLCRKISVLF